MLKDSHAMQSGEGSATFENYLGTIEPYFKEKIGQMDVM